MTAPCPRCERPLVVVEAVPTPPPKRRLVYQTMAALHRSDAKAVCTYCDLLLVGVPEYVEGTAAERRELDEATGRAAGARALFDQGDSRGAMRELARAFPSLRGLQQGLDPWDPEALDTWLARGAASEATLDIAAFVLRVWNGRGSWSRPFDAMASLARWDRVNRAVFLEWARMPWWP